MPLPLLIILIVFGIIIFVGIPMSLLYQQYQNRKKADGTYAVGLVVDRTGTAARLVMMPKDREILTDNEKNSNNPEGQPITYAATEGYLYHVLWPPQRSKFFQNTMPFGVWIEGYTDPVDVLAPFREKLKLGKIQDIQSSHIVKNIRREKLTDVMVHDADSYAQMRKQLDEALNKGRGTQMIMLFVGGITILTLIVVAVVLTTKMGHLNSSISDIKDQLEQLLGPAPTTP